MDKKQRFLQKCLPLARKAGEAFGLNPVVILAQAALETGWGESTLAVHYNNFFGITGYGAKNSYWPGHMVQLTPTSLTFRAYTDPQQSFFDYARLIRNQYERAAGVSFQPDLFAREMANSAYISEVNGDSRSQYEKSIRLLAVDIEKQLEKLEAKPVKTLPA